ncbi:hypothetical protein P171DRAFT_219374 [Karstenula rhodostoma CBS 690.94]|uniref:Uncharacterized protein n=1 Tax=Karstenula rhodostoma CBS 690.94 TaxID=1392251 RepID=A0A9P4PQZ3_9PLEO|nr:hypothetical protein P171DRAFT_219374 [Karstenula rhodostoma CBS 690.94]
MHACIARRLSLLPSRFILLYLHADIVCRWSHVSKHDSPQSLLFYILDVFFLVASLRLYHFFVGSLAL